MQCPSMGSSIMHRAAHKLDRAAVSIVPKAGAMWRTGRAVVGLPPPPLMSLQLRATAAAALVSRPVSARTGLCASHTVANRPRGLLPPSQASGGSEGSPKEPPHAPSPDNGEGQADQRSSAGSSEAADGQQQPQPQSTAGEEGQSQQPQPSAGEEGKQQQQQESTLDSPPAADPEAPAAAAGAGAAAASASGASGGGGWWSGAARGSGTVALSQRFRGPGYTFLLAGFLKIMTLGGLAATAPQDATRTAFGEVSQYLLVPVGLGMAWLAKQITDAGLHETKRFLPIMTASLVFIYFLLIKLLYRADPNAIYDMNNRRPRQRMSGPMADVRMGAGDRELLPGGMMSGGDGQGPGGRPYRARQEALKPGERPLMDDLSWYERRYPDAGGDGGAAGGGGGAARSGGRANSRSFLPPADEP